MSALEQPFIDAIAAKEIEGVIFTGKTKSGKSYCNVLGTRTLLDGSEAPLGESDILFVASCTKLLTSIAVLQCCERGQLSLDADIGSQLPTVVDKGVLLNSEGEVNAEQAAEPLKRPLTLRHLLTHSSGLAYDFLSPSLQRWRAAHPNADDASDVPARFSQPLVFQPGEGWLYGPGVDWAGYLVEKATSLRLDEYIRTHILAPLGVSSSDFSFFPVKEGMGDRMPDLNPNDPHGYGFSVSMGANVHGEVLTACFGGQGGYSTARAYLAVLYSLLANDEKILGKASVEEMLKSQLEAEARESFRKSLDTPALSLMAQGTTGKGRDYGLGGLRVGQDGDGGMGEGSLTWGGGVNSVWVLDPKNELCGFMCPQLGQPANLEKATELKALFKKELPGKLKSLK